MLVKVMNLSADCFPVELVSNVALTGATVVLCWSGKLFASWKSSPIVYISHDPGSTESSCLYRTTYKTDGNTTLNKCFVEVAVDAIHSTVLVLLQTRLLHQNIFLG